MNIVITKQKTRQLRTIADGLHALADMLDHPSNRDAQIGGGLHFDYSPADQSVSVTGDLTVLLVKVTEPVPPGHNIYMNPASLLPPVGCPLLLHVDGQLVKATRTSFVESKADELTYQTTEGDLIRGRFPWTYP